MSLGIRQKLTSGAHAGLHELRSLVLASVVNSEGEMDGRLFGFFPGSALLPFVPPAVVRDLLTLRPSRSDNPQLGTVKLYNVAQSLGQLAPVFDMFACLGSQAASRTRLFDLDQRDSLFELAERTRQLLRDCLVEAVRGRGVDGASLPYGFILHPLIEHVLTSRRLFAPPLLLGLFSYPPGLKLNPHCTASVTLLEEFNLDMPVLESAEDSPFDLELLNTAVYQSRQHKQTMRSDFSPTKAKDYLSPSMLARGSRSFQAIAEDAGAMGDGADGDAEESDSDDSQRAVTPSPVPHGTHPPAGPSALSESTAPLFPVASSSTALGLEGLTRSTSSSPLSEVPPGNAEDQDTNDSELSGKFNRLRQWYLMSTMILW